jgi:hypothetical protein
MKPGSLRSEYYTRTPERSRSMTSPPAPPAPARERRGRFKSKVVLNTWINAALDEQLDSAMEATGKEKNLIVAEALVHLFSHYREAGVI